MKLGNLFIGALAICSLAACSSGSNDSNTLTSGNAKAAPALADSNPAYERGIAAYAFTVEKGSMMVDGQSVDVVDDTTFEGYPTLAANVAELTSISKAVETRAQNLEFWSGEELILAADLHEASPSIVFSKSGMTVESLSYTHEAADQGLSTGTVTVNLKECMAPKEEDKGQDQDQDKGQDQGKIVALGSDQDKGEDKGEVQSCKLVSFTMNLREIAQPKDEDQGKGQDQDKGQDQGKVEEPAKGEDKGQDQGSKV
ncbi:MAG: hypothetical protein AB7K68_15945 [Bacteriovoracia bacterium]